jgi:hypothetical protein
MVNIQLSVYIRLPRAPTTALDGAANQNPGFNPALSPNRMTVRNQASCCKARNTIHEELLHVVSPAMN